MRQVLTFQDAMSQSSSNPSYHSCGHLWSGGVLYGSNACTIDNWFVGPLAAQCLSVSSAPSSFLHVKAALL